MRLISAGRGSGCGTMVRPYSDHLCKNDRQQQVKGDSVQKMNQAMDEIERRERMLRVPEIMERHRYHEKGYNRVRPLVKNLSFVSGDVS